MKTTTRQLLQWETRWIPVEITMVGFGLLVQQGFLLAEAGSWFLFVALAISFAVRWIHYASAGRPAKGHQLRE